jgi:SOS response regulatory protein OraA/RecX
MLTAEQHARAMKDAERIEAYITNAMDLLNRRDRRECEVWNQLDLAVPALRGLAMYLTMLKEDEENRAMATR